MAFGGISGGEGRLEQYRARKRKPVNLSEGTAGNLARAVGNNRPLQNRLSRVPDAPTGTSLGPVQATGGLGQVGQSFGSSAPTSMGPVTVDPIMGAGQNFGGFGDPTQLPYNPKGGDPTVNYGPPMGVRGFDPSQYMDGTPYGNDTISKPWIVGSPEHTSTKPPIFQPNQNGGGGFTGGPMQDGLVQGIRSRLPQILQMLRSRGGQQPGGPPGGSPLEGLMRLFGGGGNPLAGAGAGVPNTKPNFGPPQPPRYGVSTGGGGMNGQRGGPVVEKPYSY